MKWSCHHSYLSFKPIQTFSHNLFCNWASLRHMVSVDRAGDSAAEQDKAGPSSSPLPLSDLHLGAVKEVVREMLGARNWTGSSTVAALQARMSMAGHHLADNLLIKVSPLRKRT